MKYINKFENNIDLPEVGDYVLMNSYSTNSVINFVTKNFGRLTAVEFDTNLKKYKCRVRYENIPDNIDLFFHDGTRIFDIELLVEYGKTIEELKLKLQANKFNL